jgi:nucleotide-binding universal stress UspA family protein
LARALGAELAQAAAPVPRIIAMAGNPGVEVARFAELQAGDLVLLGRKTRSAMTRILVGDTADAIVRRSSVPCLFVPAPLGVPKRALVALDGTARSVGVFSRARHLLEALGASLKVLTVKPSPAEPRSALAHLRFDAGTENLRQLLEREGKVLRVRHGDVVGEILAGVAAVRASVLAVGYHRGGAPGVVEAGSVARRLVHSAPCAVLTIPL